jgi:lipopolysaccharide export system permease protein
MTDSIYLRLMDGVRYKGLPGEDNINILNFEKYDLEIVSGDVQKSISSFSEIEERDTIDLLREGGANANAEIQWRISQPISVLILSVFGVFLGKSSPRTGKGINIIIGIVIFMLYNNGLLIAKSAIESGQLSSLIGMWSIHLFLLLFLLIFYQFRQGKVTYFIDKISFFNTKEKSHV